MALKSGLRWVFPLALLAAYTAGKLSLARAAADIVVGSKNFTESLLLGELYALALEQGGLRVERKFNLGGTLVAHEALKRGEIDFYPEYTGTALIDVLNLPMASDADEVFRSVSEAYRGRWNLLWLEPSRANDAQGLVIARAVAERLHVRTLTDLAAAAPKLRLASIPEFEERADGLIGLQRAFGGFRFAQTRLYDNGLKYRAVLNGEADVTVAFTTDGALVDDGWLVVEDNRGYWPPYRVAPVMRAELAQRFPLVPALAKRISAALDTVTLRRLNAEVDVRHRDYREVARDFAKLALSQEKPQ